MLSSFIAMPQGGHMQQLFNIFAYLKVHHNARLVMDPSYPNIDQSTFGRRDWTEFYGDLSLCIARFDVFFTISTLKRITRQLNVKTKCEMQYLILFTFRGEYLSFMSVLCQLYLSL